MLLKKIWDVDALKCSKCGGEVKVISLIEHPSVIRRILKHLDLYTGLASTLSGIVCRILLPGLSVLVKLLHPVETVEDQTQGSAQVQRNNK